MIEEMARKYVRKNKIATSAPSKVEPAAGKEPGQKVSEISAKLKAAVAPLENAQELNEYIKGMTLWLSRSKNSSTETPVPAKDSDISDESKPAEKTGEVVQIDDNRADAIEAAKPEIGEVNLTTSTEDTNGQKPPLEAEGESDAA